MMNTRTRAFPILAATILAAALGGIFLVSGSFNPDRGDGPPSHPEPGPSTERPAPIQLSSPSVESPRPRSLENRPDQPNKKSNPVEPKTSDSPTTVRGEGPYMQDPTPGALERLAQLSAQRDAVGLLELALKETSLVRYEALQRHLELVGTAGLLPLVRLLQEEPDPALHRLLGDAFSAGGDAPLAEHLAGLLERLDSPTGRMAASLGIIGITERIEIQEKTVAVALSSLDRMARKNADLAPDVCEALSRSGRSGFDRLASLASDTQLEESTRLSAAEALFLQDPERGRPGLETLAAQATDPNIRQLARSYLEEQE